MIGCTALSSAMPGVNIAAMQWSRNKKGEKAVAFVSVDQNMDNETLDEIRSIDGVLKVSLLKF